MHERYRSDADQLYACPGPRVSVLRALVLLLPWVACAPPPGGPIPAGADRSPRATLPCPPGTMVFIGTVGFPDLQSAIDASVDGDTLQVCPGHWVQRRMAVHARGTGFRLVGMTSDPEDTVIDGDRVDRILGVGYLVGDIHIERIAFINGALPAVRYPLPIDDPSVLVLSIAGLPSPNPTSEVVIENCRFEDNHGPEGRVGGSDGAVGIVGVRAGEIRDSHFVRNHSGSGIAASRRAVVTDSTFLAGARSGAAIGVGNHWETVDHALELEVSRVRVVDAQAYGEQPSAIHIMANHRGPVSVLVEDTEVLRNEAIDLWPHVGEAGAVLIEARQRPLTAVEIRRSTFDGNVGDAYAHLGLRNEDPEHVLEVTLSDVTLWRGRATGLRGGYMGEETIEGGAAILMQRGIRGTYGDIRLHLRDVDVGEGPTENHGGLLAGCPRTLTGVVDADFSLLPGEGRCP